MGPIGGKPKLLAADEVESATHRLYASEMEARRARKAALDKKYLSRGVSPRHKIAKEQKEASVARLYTASLEKQKEVMNKAVLLYSPERESRKLTPEEVKAVNDRLSTKA